MKKRFLGFLGALCLMVCLLATNVFAASSACSGHSYSTFNGSPACTKNGALHLCAKNFPDSEFLLAIKENWSYYMDDNYLSAQEVKEKLTWLQVHGYNYTVTDVQGLEFFTGLQYLYLYELPLDGINLSKNVNLTSLEVNGCGLTSLDVTKLTKLEYLSCSNNQLKSLNVSKNTKLEELSCGGNMLSALGVANLPNLQSLYCADNLLTSLNVTNNTALKNLRCGTNKLTSLDVSKNTALTELSCESNQLTALGLTNNTKLSNLRCGNNKLSSLNLSKNVYLKSLDCYSNNLTSLNVAPLTRLMQLYCSNNKLTALDVSKNTKLEELECSNNKIAKLDVSKCEGLKYFYCSGNALTSLDLSKNQKLTGVSAYDQKAEYGKVFADASVYTFNMAELVGSANIGKVSDVGYSFEDRWYGWGDADYNSKTGIATFANKPTGLDYYYDTGCGSEKMYVEVTFKNPPATGIALDASTLLLETGEYAYVTPTLTPAGCDQEVTYRTGNTAVATVSENGTVYGVGTGNTYLYATTASGVTAQCLIRVRDVMVESVELPYYSYDLALGDTFKLDATVSPANASNKALTYRSGNSSVATVDSNGNVKGVKEGNTYIYAESTDGVSARCLVRVKAVAVESVTYSESTKILRVGSSFTFAPTVNPSNASNKTLTFKVGNSTIASVDANGKVTAKKAGNTYLYATSNNGKELKVLLKVQAAPTSIDVPAEQSVIVGNTVQIGYTLAPSGCYADNVTYSVGNGTVASVDANGNVKGLKEGNTYVTVKTAGGLTDKCLVRVKAVPVESVTYSVSTKTMKVGTSFTFAPTVSPSNANQTLTFKVGNGAIASVDANGKVTAKSVGNTYLYATANNGVQCKVLLKVQAAPTSISVASALNIGVGETVKVGYTLGPGGCYADTVTYSVGNSSVATVDANGNVTGLKAANTWLYVKTSDGLTAKCLIRVS